MDTGVLIDLLRRVEGALDWWSSADAPCASEISRLEVLRGMRSNEREATLRLLDSLTWHPIDQKISTLAGALGRTYRRSHQGIDVPDLCVAATAQTLGAPLATTNIGHFPMFAGLSPPY